MTELHNSFHFNVNEYLNSNWGGAGGACFHVLAMFLRKMLPQCFEVDAQSCWELLDRPLCRESEPHIERKFQINLLPPRSLNSVLFTCTFDWFANSFIMVVYKKVQFSQNFFSIVKLKMDFQYITACRSVRSECSSQWQIKDFSEGAPNEVGASLPSLLDPVPAA